MARNVSAQVFGLFPAFRAKALALALAENRAACPCDACQNIRYLLLKAIVHWGEAAFRKIRQFEEMAGEDVIIVHRLLKNGVEAAEYVLMTETLFRRLDPAVQARGRGGVERYEHLSAVAIKVFDPAVATAPEQPAPAGSRVRRLAARLGRVPPLRRGSGTRRLGLSERVVGLDQLAQLFLQHMGIDLRGRDVDMAKHLLHRAQVGAMGQQMRGKGVAQHVRRDAAQRQTGVQRQFLQQLPDALAGQPPIPPA